MLLKQRSGIPSYPQLERDGYTVMPEFLSQDALNQFELTIDQLTRRLASRRGLKNLSQDPMADLLKIGGQFRELLFLQLKNLHIIQTISAQVGEFLSDSGFWKANDVLTPLVWPTLRADPPGEATYLLPLHQDYGTIRSHRAWRMWIPLRPVDQLHGSMKIVKGSHRRGPIPHNSSDPRYPYVEQRHIEGLQTEVVTLPAGAAVFMNPLTVHGSVPNVSNRVKYVLLIQIQDHAAMIDPDDPDDELAAFIATTRIRAGADKGQG
jgi:hypothetical protein